MGRPLRIEYPGAHYHVTTRGNERRDVFKSKRDREKFLSYLESAAMRYGAVIHTYCLMSNHYHLLLETPAGNLSQIMQHINGAYTNYFNTKRKRSGHLFQGRFKAILIEADEYAMALSRYIHLNPVRVGIVNKPEEYQWSSYREYIGIKETPAWLRTAFVLRHFSKDPNAMNDKYRSFVEDLLGKEYDSPLNASMASTMLGSAEFVQEIMEGHIVGKHMDRDLPALRTLSNANHPTIEIIAKCAKDFVGNEVGLAEKAGIYLAHKYSGAKLKEIGNYFGKSQSSVTQISYRFRQMMGKDDKVKKLIEQLERTIGMSDGRVDRLLPML